MGHTRNASGNMDFDFEAEIDAKDALRKASLKAEGITTSSEDAVARKGGKYSTVCRHWLRNLCVRGDKCDYLHQYDPKKMPECFEWLQSGKCNDPDCCFRHVEASERPECKQYRRGFCKLGPMCRSRHDRLPRSGIPEVLPDWFLDQILLNLHLVPKLEVSQNEGGKGKGRNGSANQLALLPMAFEDGTVPGLPPPIHGKCRYFLVRSVNVRNVQISAAKGIWASSHANAQRMRQSFRDVDHVILIFASTEGRSFHGYAKMLAEPDDKLFPGIWGEMSCRLSPNIKVSWLKQCSLPANRTDHIKNAQLEDKPVRHCRDGQDLPSTTGENLCRFLWQQPNHDLLQGSDLRYELDDITVPAEQEHAAPASPRKKSIAVTLALEDSKKDDDKKDSGVVDHGRAGPAPTKMGTFQSDGSWKSQGGGISVGKALASGSSSLLADLAKDAQQHGHHAPMGWPGPVPGWSPHPMEQHPAYGYPPAGYYPPAYGAPPAGHPHFDPRYGAVPGGPHEAQPAGWGDRAGNRFSVPPDAWQGASNAVGSHGTSSREHRGKHARSRSRSRDRKRRKHKK